MLTTSAQQLLARAAEPEEVGQLRRGRSTVQPNHPSYPEPDSGGLLAHLYAIQCQHSRQLPTWRAQQVCGPRQRHLSCQHAGRACPKPRQLLHDGWCHGDVPLGSNVFCATRGGGNRSQGLHRQRCWWVAAGFTTAVASGHGRRGWLSIPGSASPSSATSARIGATSGASS